MPDAQGGAFALVPPVASDACGPVPVQGLDLSTGQTIDPNNVALPAGGTTTIRWTAPTSSGTATKDQTVSVVPCMLAAQAFNIADGVALLRLDGAPISVASAGSITVAAEGAVGSITAVGSVDVRDRATVSGDITTSGAVNVSSNANFSGEILPLNNPTALADMAQAMLAGFEENLPSGANDVLVYSGTGPVDLQPGSYGSVIAYPGTELRITPGTYVASVFEVHPQAVVTVVGNGPVKWVVNESTFWQGEQDHAPASTDQFQIIYMGSGTAYMNTAFEGFVIAPRANLRLAPLNNNGEFRGLFIADTLQIEAHNRVVVDLGQFHP